MARFYFIVCISLAVCVPAAEAAEPRPIRLWLTPARSPSPPLRYQLLPDSRLLTPGDAAPIYKQIVELLTKKPRIQEDTVKESVREMPLHRLPKETLRKELSVYDDVIELLEKAARCDHCEWGYRERLREKGI